MRIIWIVVLVQSKIIPLNFPWFFFLLMWLNSIYCFVLSLRIKYDNSKNKTFIMGKFSSVVFDSIENHKFYLCLILFILVWLNLFYCFVFSMRIKYDGSKNNFFFVMRTISILFLIRSKMYVTSELLIQTKNICSIKKLCGRWVVHRKILQIHMILFEPTVLKLGY